MVFEKQNPLAIARQRVRPVSGSGCLSTVATGRNSRWVYVENWWCRCWLGHPPGPCHEVKAMGVTATKPASGYSGSTWAETLAFTRVGTTSGAHCDMIHRADGSSSVQDFAKIGTGMGVPGAMPMV